MASASRAAKSSESETGVEQLTYFLPTSGWTDSATRGLLGGHSGTLAQPSDQSLDLPLTCRQERDEVDEGYSSSG